MGEEEPPSSLGVEEVSAKISPLIDRLWYAPVASGFVVNGFNGKALLVENVRGSSLLREPEITIGVLSLGSNRNIHGTSLRLEL